jgi:hypothetical protein
MVAWVGCARETSKTKYVARVDDAVLTAEQLREQTGGDTLSPAGDYVAAWVTSELLYHEAKRRGLADDDGVLTQVEQARRQFAVNALLEREVFSADTTTLATDVLMREFEEQRDLYRLREDVVNISYAMFGERDAANAFRSKLLRGMAWHDALDSIKAEMPEALLRSARHAYFTQGSLYPEELWKATRALRKEDVSYAIRSEAGYGVMIVHSTKAQGEIPDFEYVREEVRSRVLLRLRREKYNALLSRLRTQHRVEVALPSPDEQRQE